MDNAILAAFRSAELALPVDDADPPTKETVEAFMSALAEQGYRIVSVEAAP